jgi:hypothetical protein
MTPTPSTAAALMRATLEQLHWHFSLNDQGQLTLIIGDDLPGLPQCVLMAALGSLAPEFEVLLARRAAAQDAAVH